MRPILLVGMIVSMAMALGHIEPRGEPTSYERLSAVKPGDITIATAFVCRTPTIVTCGRYPSGFG